jgi:hypothetical protein
MQDAQRPDIETSHQPSFTFMYPLQWGESWHCFKVNDVELLQKAELSPLWFNQTGMFIASLNHKSQLRELLEACGFALNHYHCSQFIFRTSNPTVEKWALEWTALVARIHGHRPRYLMDRYTSPNFFKLIARAHELRRINTVKKLKWN